MNNLQKINEVKNWKNLQTGNLFTRKEMTKFFSEGDHLSKGEPEKQKKEIDPILDRLDQLGKKDRLPKFRLIGNKELYKTRPILPSTGTTKNSHGYYAKITKGQKVYSLGNYKTMEQAHQVYLEAKKLLSE